MNNHSIPHQNNKPSTCTQKKGKIFHSEHRRHSHPTFLLPSAALVHKNKATVKTVVANTLIIILVVNLIASQRCTVFQIISIIGPANELKRPRFWQKYLVTL